MSRFPVKTVAIIGGGALGAVALDVLLKEGAFEVTLFERLAQAGGVWVLDGGSSKLLGELNGVGPGATPATVDPATAVPEFGASAALRTAQPHRFEETPAYAGIRTNIPEKYMTFLDRPTWPELDQPDVDTLTTREAVVEYIQSYIRPNEAHVRYNTTVERVRRQDGGFEVVTREQRRDTDVWTRHRFDAVVVAVGHYSIPYIPEVAGLGQVAATLPGVVEHAKFFRDAARYRGKRVVVVGLRALGLDIAKLAAEHGAEVYLSKRTETVDSKLLLRISALPEGVSVQPAIERFLVQDSRVLVHFANGVVVPDVHHVVYGTGYYYLFPFLREEFPGFVAATHDHLPRAFQHTFFIDEPRVAVLGAPTDALSLRAFEYQAVWVLRVFAGKVELPGVEEQEEWVRARRAHAASKAISPGRAYHTIGLEEAAEFRDALAALGGGIAPLGQGRPFPVLSEEDRREIAQMRVSLGLNGGGPPEAAEATPSTTPATTPPSSGTGSPK